MSRAPSNPADHSDVTAENWLDLEPDAAVYQTIASPPSQPMEPNVVDLLDAFLAASHRFFLLSRRSFGDQHLSLSRVKVLLALAESTLRQDDHLCMRDLAQELEVTPRNITTIVDGLEREGLLARHPDPHDRRAIWLELTPVGLSQIYQVQKLKQDISTNFFEPLDPSSRGQLAMILTRLGGDRGHRLPHEQQCPRDETARANTVRPRRLRGRNRRPAE